MAKGFLRTAREASGLTQDEVAERARVERTMIVRLEQDPRALKVERVNDLAAALNISPDALLRGLGVNLAPRKQDLLDQRLVAELLEAPADVMAAVQLLLNGWRAEQSRHTQQDGVPAATTRGRLVFPRSRSRGQRQA